MFTCTCVQDEVTHHRLRGGSKNPSNKAAAMGTRGAYATYVNTEIWRSACALARRSAPARRREAAFSLRSHFGEGGPAKAGNAAGGFFQQIRQTTFEPSAVHDILMQGLEHPSDFLAPSPKGFRMAAGKGPESSRYLRNTES
jgi:hypothetical protein